MDFAAYSKKLDELLDRIRASYLGQMVNFSELVPPGANLAERTAQVLTFQMSRVSALSEAELAEAHSWLRLACRFLVERCPPEDAVICNLLKLLELDTDTLEMLTPESYTNEEAWVFSRPPEFLAHGLELVAWEMLEDHLKSGALLKALQGGSDE